MGGVLGLDWTQVESVINLLGVPCRERPALHTALHQLQGEARAEA